MSVVVVSWILTLLAVFGLTYSHEARNESQLVQLEVERHQLRAWAQSGVELVLAELDRPQVVDGEPLEPVTSRLLFSEPRSCGRGSFAVGEAVLVGGTEIWLPGIVDEAGRLPIALADSISLATLPGMTAAGVKVILRAKAAAARDLMPPVGLLADLDYLSRDCALRYLSRYGNSVNVNSASFDVLFAVGLPQGACRKMLKWRAGPDGAQGTTDDQWFRSLEANDPGIAGCTFNNEEAAVLAFLRGTGRLSVESRYFSLSSRGWGPGTYGICEVKVIVKKPENGQAKVIELTENWLN
ncbi:MAG: hypothetical protein KOO60_03250 [Gemmatimonadales bacterium]|nr:hypothetical protein [Gemmatimonadales bacterium]